MAMMNRDLARREKRQDAVVLDSLQSSAMIGQGKEPVACFFGRLKMSDYFEVEIRVQEALAYKAHLFVSSRGNLIRRFTVVRKV